MDYNNKNKINYFLFYFIILKKEMKIKTILKQNRKTNNYIELECVRVKI